ncbi:TPA: WxL domain-containing protein [Enterococcus faecalis]|nr:WxL domain-containing protein [Enterococcus faecalis]HAP4674451.1 WxL domain-containing protein [Enterococcus faecalis]HAP4677694.1 WxL domain-containing protein [Enterococcus faecalis]HAP4683479.1 WxL domain-containing protein [Enterococcus faecalis]
MKQTKWQRLATIGLCSSLVINAFSGATAVAETITIESSPTVASSAKEATSASSATPASTESSQETTETIREEVTQETEKPEVVKEETQTEAKKQEEETVTSEVVQPNPVLTPTPVSGIGIRAGNLAETYQYFLEIQKNFQINGSQAQVVTPNIAIGVNLTSSEGATVNIDDFELRSTVRTRSGLWDQSYGGYRNTYHTPENISSTKLTNSIQMNIPSKIVRAQANATYTRVNYSFSLEDVSLSVPKYISNVLVGEPLAIKGIRVGAFAIPTTATLDLKKINQETYKLETNTNTGTAAYVFSTTVDHSLNRSGFGTVLAEKDLELSVVFKKVTESFKDTAGATIPAPTGFTQGKQTSITSNNYTFKQAGTLPETYKASNGKTYQFKGWYKGKTKPNTLTTTKAPSYAVTYDDNDDLNVVYEEVNFPETTYQFGFVNEAGQLVNPEDINLTYDYKSIVFRGTGGADSTVSFGTIANNQSGVKVGNLRQVTLPAKNIAQPTATGWNGEAFANFSIKLPNYYKSLNLYDKTGKIDPKYPLPVKATVSSASSNAVQSEASVIADLTLTQRADGSFTPRETYSVIDPSVRYPGFLRRVVSYSSSGSTTATHQTISGPVYYHLTNRKVTESFKDTAGATIPAPTGFTQGKQTSITSNNYTFKQAGTLPETYKASNGKTYQFKGWYKGKTKPNTLTTTKAPSYAVTYDDNDDLNVVYEEIEVFDFPALTYQFGFVDESGKRVDASTIDLTYDKWRGEVLTNNVNDWKTVSLEKGQVAPTKNNLKEIVYPSHSLEIMNGRSSQYSAANLTFKIPKYYENISVYNKNGTFDTAYPFPTVKINTSTTPLSNRSQLFQLKKSNNQSFIFNQTTEAAPADVQVPYNLREIVYDPAASINKGLYHMLDKPIYYYLTNRKVTENFVDANGTKITPPTGFTQGNQIPMTSNTFKYTATRALPASYSVGGKTYIFQGWYKGKTKPNTLTTSTTPTYNTTFDGNDDMTAMYKEEVPKASVALTRTTAETVTSGGNVTWRATITNTSQAPLTTATIKKSTAWTTGLAAPTAMIVTPAGGTAKTVPVTATTWTNGVSLGTDIPAGKSATVQFTTKATGTARQVLRAGITTSGNYSGVSASATVRVKDNDQAIVTPTAEGFISVPTFNFGQVGVAGSTQQHGLKKAADYYGNGTRNPYLRIKKTQPNWSLTAQLSQPKSATDSLPTATRLLLGAAPVSSFSNYNQPTELKNAVGTTSAISLNANNTATRIIANQQFTGSNIYQLDFTFNNVKLEVPANQGVKGQQYQAAVTWNLVTGP